MDYTIDNKRLIDMTSGELGEMISSIVSKAVDQRLALITPTDKERHIVYSQKEAAKLLGVSPSTLIRYARDGRLKDGIGWNGRRSYAYDIERCRELIYGS